MAFESALRIHASPKCAGYTYNYFGSRAGEQINYNNDNRIPVSPMRLTGGNEDRAIKMYPGSTHSRHAGSHTQ